MLKVENLSIAFHSRNGRKDAVKNVSFELEAGSTLGIVGESGSGKSMTCYSLMGLIPMPPGKIESGSALFHEQDLLKLPEKALRDIRGSKISMRNSYCRRTYHRIGCNHSGANTGAFAKYSRTAKTVYHLYFARLGGGQKYRRPCARNERRRSS